MATANYMTGRRQYQRPQALLFADNPGRKETIVNPTTGLSEIHYIPNGYEVGASVPSGIDQSLVDQFIVLSDDNRQPISFGTIRIENRQRMINGRMRSYHIADKLTISAAWDLLPSRSFMDVPLFDANGKPSKQVPGDANNNSIIQPGETVPITTKGNPYNSDKQYTSDGGAGGAELLDWYENHQGSFWVYLSYDKYPSFGKDTTGYSQLNKYSQVVEVFFSDFSYSVVKRGGSNHDFWNISLTLEEV